MTSKEGTSKITGRETINMRKCRRERDLEDDDKRHLWEDEQEDTPLIHAVLTHVSYTLLAIVGHVRDFFLRVGIEKCKAYSEPYIRGFVPLFQKSGESFYARHVYRRVSPTLARPVASVPGGFMDIHERKTDDYGWNYKMTGKKYENVMNLGSYNYLGLSQNKGPCADAVEDKTRELGVSTAASRQELGYHEIHRELDDLVAEYLGVEAALTIPMGFATNSMNMPCLVQKGCLILSDQLNHASLILGSRLSGATIKTFKHNDMEDLEKKLRKSILDGQPGRNRAWKKILIVVEGVYSMEGSIVRLPDVVRLKNKYGAYLYLDEAHSIGAMGPQGKGVVDYFGLDPKDIDVMMGTFTKSFGAAGGYIGGSKKLINYLRKNSHSTMYAPTMSACVAQQVISSMRIIMGKDNTNEGRRRIDRLRWNIGYFRRRLKEMGFIVYGNNNSAVVPLLIYQPAKLIAFSCECLERGLAVVVVGYPATPLVESRARFCLSAAHDKKNLDYALDIIEKAGDMFGLKYSSMNHLPYKETVEIEKRENGHTCNGLHTY